MATLKIRVSILLLIIPILLMANDEKVEQFMRDLSASYDNIETFQSDFTQVNSWAAMDNQLESVGKVYYDSETLIMLYQAPDEQVLKITENEISVYTASTGQMMISDNDNITLQPLEILKKYWEISTIHLNEMEQGFTVKLEYAGGKVEASIIDYLIQDIIIYDEKGNKVSYHFKSMLLNQKLPENIFEIEVGENVEIIDMRKTDS